MDISKYWKNLSKIFSISLIVLIACASAAFAQEKPENGPFFFRFIKERESVVANIIKADEDNQTYTLNKGAQDGILLNRKVYTEEGLIGVIYEVEEHFSKMRPLSEMEEQQAICCAIDRTFDLGCLLIGNGADNEVFDLSEPESVVDGDKVVILDMDYPNEIPVGFIKKNVDGTLSVDTLPVPEVSTNVYIFNYEDSASSYYVYTRE